MGAELWTREVCVVDTGGTVAADTDMGLALAAVTWVLMTSVVVTPTACSGEDVVVVTVGNGAGVAPVEVVTGGGMLSALWVM